MTRPSLGRLLWTSNSTWPHHIGGSGAATCPEKVTYSEVSPVSPDPHEKVSDPCIYGAGLQVWSRTSMCANRTPGMGSRPLYGVQAVHNEVPGSQDRAYLGLNQVPGGGPVSTRVQTWSGGIRTLSHTLLLPAQTETRCCHVVNCARRKPTGEAWHKASRLRASLHLLWIRRASVHSSDRRRAQSTLRGPCCYSHVTIARTMTHYYSRVTRKRVTAYQYCMDCSHHDSHWLRMRYYDGENPNGSAYTPLLMCAVSINYSHNIFLPLFSWARMSELSILVCTPLNYKREGIQRYKGHGQYNLHTVEVGYYAPAAWTTINPRVFLCSSNFF
jgi:hypothetical protein